MKPRPAPVCRPGLRRPPLLAVLAALGVLAGCDTLVVGKVDPGMFPAAAAASAPPLNGRAALELLPVVRGQLQPGPDMCAVGRQRLQLPLGAIVDAALQRQLGAGFVRGVQPAALPLPLPAAGGVDADVDVAVSVTAMRLALDFKANWTLPVPVAVSSNYTARLELDLRLTDALGRLIAQTTVDSGTVLLERGLWTRETPDERCLKLTHQAAWQAAEQAARVAREALLADRQRERAL